MGLKGVLFDFDGTLADTAGDIAASVNHALGRFFGSQRFISLEQCRKTIGRGLRNELKDSLDFLGLSYDERSLNAGLKMLEEYYGRHPVDFTKPYEGIPLVLEFCKKLGLALGVFSNKAQKILETVIHRLFPNARFDYVCGLRPDLPRKPSPEGLWRFSDSLGIPRTPDGRPLFKRPAEDGNPAWSGPLAETLPGDAILYVGDSEIDWLTGRSAGVPTLIATWGFRSRERLAELGIPSDVLVDSQEALMDAIGRLV